MLRALFLLCCSSLLIAVEIPFYKIDDLGLARVKGASEEEALKEKLDGDKKNPEERAIVLAIAKKVNLCSVWYNAEGHIEYLWISGHGIFKHKGGTEKRPGINGEDLATIAGLKHLRALLVHHQPNVPNEAYQVLDNFPDLEAFSIEYHRQTGDFQKYLRNKPKLKTLHLKHLFGTKGTLVDTLGTYPELEVVELDNESAGPKAEKFLLANPTIVDLELHRSSLSNEAIERISKAMPNLKRLALKTARGGFDKSCVQYVKNLPMLESFELHGKWPRDQFTWDDIKVLAEMPQLKHVKHVKPTDGPAWQQLAEKRPELFSWIKKK